MQSRFLGYQVKEPFDTSFGMAQDRLRANGIEIANCEHL